MKMNQTELTYEFDLKRTVRYLERPLKTFDSYGMVHTVWRIRNELQRND